LRERLRIGEVAKLVGVTPKTLRHYPEWTAEPMGSVFFEVMAAGVSPAQRRFFELCQEMLPLPERGDTG
jgi:hypothetical protein